MHIREEAQIRQRAVWVTIYIKPLEHIHRLCVLYPTHRKRSRGYSESVQATTGHQQLSLHSLPVYIQVLRGVAKIGTHPSQSPARQCQWMLVCFGVAMKSREERISGSCGMWEHEWKNRKRFNLLVSLCVWYMFWIQQLPHLSLGKPSIVSPWPWCVSWLQSLWRIDLLFILLHLHFAFVKTPMSHFLN